MTMKAEYQKLIEERKKIVEIVDYEKEPIIQSMLFLLTKDINETIKFVLEDCTEDEYIWLSEIFDEIVQKTNSKEFIEALRKTALKYPEATKKYNLFY